MLFFGKKDKKLTFREKLDMYDMLIANFLAGNSIIEPSVVLDNSKLSIGYSNLASETTLTKYFTIVDFPTYLPLYFIANLRDGRILKPGVRINVYMYSTPHKIKWESPEMRSKLNIWKEYSEKINNEEMTVFEYRNKRDSLLANNRIQETTGYLNVAEKDQKRTTMKTSILIEIKCKRDDASLMNMTLVIKSFKDMCMADDIKYRELKGNLMDWVSYLGIFSLRYIKEIESKLTKKIFTDDVLAYFNPYRQGRVGTDGCMLGIDIHSSLPVFRKFKQDPEGADNWLISAETGGGKSYFVKYLLTNLLADNFVVMVLDYEGDEYTNLAYYLAYNAEEDVQIISMGKGSSQYFDPMPIGNLTGNDEIDSELKQTAIEYTVAMFRTMVCGLKGSLTNTENRVLSLAIRRVYDSAEVTEDKSTWKNSKNLTIRDVYEELVSMVDSKELVDEFTDNAEHKAALNIVDVASVYFNEGEAKFGIFENPIAIDSLLNARFIDFSFGNKGASSDTVDQISLALKQLSVANISIQIANHCKYVRHCFNVKVWEEFQRWGAIESSGNIIINEITGGRKRGTVNLIITNSLNSLLNEKNEVNRTLVNNIQSYAIGKITDLKTRKLFCDIYSRQELLPTLNQIGNVKGKGSGMQSKWKHSFCLAMDDGKTAVVKVMLPPKLAKSNIFTSTNIEQKRNN